MDDSYTILIGVMAASYSLTLIVYLARMPRIREFARTCRHTRAFYTSILVQVVLRTTAFLVLAFARNEIDEYFLFLVLTLPDMFFMVNYLLLVFQYISVFYSSHMESDFTAMLLYEFLKPKDRQVGKLIWVVILLWLGLQAVLYCLLAFGFVTNRVIILEVCICGLSSATIGLLLILLLLNRYSLTPFKSLLAKDRLAKISCVTFL